MSHHHLINSKIIQSEDLPSVLNEWRSKGKKIVFTNGCFDILHKGHIDYLSQAADLGDVLIVGLNSDNSVKKLKGFSRPIQDQDSRLMILAGLECVSAVVIFDEPTPYELIKEVQPDVLAKGADYKPEEIVGYDVVKSKGGEIKTIEFLPGYSTSGIEKKIVENAKDQAG